jgi:hypothetical protein
MRDVCPCSYEEGQWLSALRRSNPELQEVSLDDRQEEKAARRQTTRTLISARDGRSGGEQRQVDVVGLKVSGTIAIRSRARQA